MINLRYHIVSITAVFLALGIGIAMGSSFLSDAAIDQVDRNIQSTREEARAAREEAAELREELAELEARSAELLEQGAARLFRDHLEGVPVVLVTVGGVDEDSLELLRTALASSEAQFEGTLTITGDVTVPDGAVDTLRVLLDADEDTSAAELRARLVAAVADELLAAAASPAEEGEGGEGGDPGDGGEGGTTTSTTAPGDPGTTTPAEVPPAVPGDTTTTTAPEEAEEPFSPDLLRSLVSEGVMDYEPAPGGLPIEEALADPGHRYVVVSGPDADVADTQFLHPLLRALTEDGPAPVVVASASVGEEAEATRASVVAPLLEDEQLADRISTVDDLETIGGIAAVVLALDDLGIDRRGHYGIGPGAESQLPLP